MRTGDLYAEARFALVTAANHFLFTVLPLRRLESLQALDRFVTFVTDARLPAPALDAVLIRVLAILDRQTQGRLPELVQRYLASPTFSGNAARFEECVKGLLRHRGIDDPDVEAAITVLESHFRDAKLTPHDVADRVHVRLDDLRPKFVSITGLTIEEYKRGLRLDQAAIELASTVRSIKEIWAGVGYNHHENFCHEFKERFGVSPTQHRDDAHAVQAPRDRTLPHAADDVVRHPDRATILLIDDDDSFRDTTARLFASTGYRVKQTPDGAEGLRLATRESFDAIVLDHRLGPVTGLEVLRSFRRNSQRPPVVLFSADWTIENDSDEIRALGATTMSKLSDFESLERLVSSLCAMPIEGEGPDRERPR